MKSLLLRQVIEMSKRTFYGFILQSILYGAIMASDLNAQNSEKSIQNIYVTVEVVDVSIKNVFNQIEQETGFSFAYSSQKVDLSRRISLNYQNTDLATVLIQISKEANLKFKRINNSIQVGKRKNSESIEIEEKINNQVITITGRVTSSEDESGLPGVNVIVKGTSHGTVTDVEGNYSLDVPDENTIVVFSSVGYVTGEVVVGNQTIINVILTTDLKALEEIVVIGYGTAKKSDLTGSVSQLKGDYFENQAVTNFSEMLTGTVAGVYSNQSARAAGGSSLEVRGPSSISAGTTPLLVVDGAIYDGNMADINPMDIEKIDILKDASSAAIYGATSAAGVIIITTKKGRLGKPTINFSAKVGVSEPTKNRRSLVGEEYLNFRGDLFSHRSLNDPSVSSNFYTDPNNLPDDITVEEWLSYNPNAVSDPTDEYLNRLNLTEIEKDNYNAGKVVDWYPLLINNGLNQTYDVSIAGGTEHVKYYWSVGYTDRKGIVAGDVFSAVRSKLNLDFKVTDWLSVGANIQFSDRDESAVPASLTRMYMVSPYGDVYNEDGSVKIYPHDEPNSRTPLDEYEHLDRERKINSIFSDLYANVKLPFGINYKLSFQPRYDFRTSADFWGEDTYRGSLQYTGGYGTRSSSKIFHWRLDNILTWKKQMGIHNIDITLLYNSEQYNYYQSSMSNSNFSPNDKLGYHALQFGQDPIIQNYDSKSTGDALMGRINYILNDKYLFTVSARRDGYSAFGQENPRAIFPAAAFAWKISDENFFNNTSTFNRLKLRLSYGVNGNRAIGAYSAMARLSTLRGYDGTNVEVGTYVSSLANTGLRWEKTTTFNFGFNLGMFEDRISLTSDFYIGKTTDLLLQRKLPAITGFSSVLVNLGELENRGMEFTLNTVNISSTTGFNWKSDFVFSLNRNKIVSLFGDTGNYKILGEERSGEVPDFDNGWFPGEALDVVWDYDLIGIWQMEEKDAAAEYGLFIGDFKALDVNEDKEYEDIEDKRFIGYEKPRYLIGFGNTFSYKNWSASLFIRADLGHIARYNEALQSGNSVFDRINYRYAPMPYWTPENRNNEWCGLQPNVSSFGGGLNIYKDASFVRIQDLSLAYNLPSDVINRLKMKSVRFYVSIRNLYSFDNWPGWDPESRNFPMPRTYTLGINVTL